MSYGLLKLQFFLKECGARKLNEVRDSVCFYMKFLFTLKTEGPESFHSYIK